MIAEYEDLAARQQLKSPRSYALKLTHKHLPEMQAHAGLAHPPVFTPVVCNTYAGMAVQTFLPLAALAKKISVGGIAEILAAHYDGEKFVRVLPVNTEQGLDAGCMDMTACNNTNRAEIFVFGHDAEANLEEQIILITRLDNLGKGASGAAVQSMNLMLGFDEALGLSA
jgi:N-acetyl-gamma-glutamyl-phosphate reductase